MHQKCFTNCVKVNLNSVIRKFLDGIPKFSSVTPNYLSCLPLCEQPTKVSVDSVLT